MPDKVWRQVGTFSIGAEALITEETPGVFFIGNYDANKKRHGAGLVVDQVNQQCLVGKYRNGVFEGDICDFEGNNAGTEKFKFLRTDNLSFLKGRPKVI